MSRPNARKIGARSWYSLSPSAEGERRAEDGDDGGLGHHEDVGAERRRDQEAVHELQCARDDREGLDTCHVTTRCVVANEKKEPRTHSSFGAS